jgi:hypothetical protein
MLTLSELSSTIARLTCADQSHVALVVSHLQKAELLPAYSNGAPGRPKEDERLKADHNHAAIILAALMASDRPAAAPEAVRFVNECVFSSAHEQVFANAESSGSSAFFRNDGLSEQLIAAFGRPSALVGIANRILSIQAGLNGGLEVITFGFSIQPDSAYFNIDLKDLMAMPPQAGTTSMWFVRLGTDIPKSLRSGIPSFTVNLPGKLLHDIASALGDPPPELVSEFRRQHGEKVQAYLATRDGA